MRSVTCSMGVSVDGCIVGPDGGFDWAAPDEELFRFFTLRYRLARYQATLACVPEGDERPAA